MRPFSPLFLAAALAASARADERTLDPQGRALLDEIRVQALRPDALIARIRISKTTKIADVGAGPPLRPGCTAALRLLLHASR